MLTSSGTPARHLLIHTAYVSYPVDEDANGNTTWSDPLPIACRFVERFVRTASFTGQEVASSAQIITDVPVGANWRIWPPGTAPGSSNFVVPKNVVQSKSPYHPYALWEVLL